jgi:hypothetical protein
MMKPIAFVLLLAGAARADGEPTVAKDSVVVTAQEHSGSTDLKKGQYGWRPFIKFRVNGPVASGSQLSVEFGYAGKAKWLKLDCPTNEVEAGQSFVSECNGGDKDITPYTGPVDFTIRLRNELTSKNAVLFSGKAKVQKGAAVKGTDAVPFWVDEDWRIPIGYVSFEKDNSHGDDVFLTVGFWIRGNPPNVEAHLFYKGKDLSKWKQAGNGAGDYKPADHKWGLYEASFLGVYPTKNDDGYDPKFDVSKNPGEYEMKALVNGHLARSIKFTVGADGKLDLSSATANKLGSEKVIVPVTVIGGAEPYDKSAYKSGAYYGNPLKGFTP